MTYKVHMRKGIDTVRCGQPVLYNFTFDPKKVTCKNCLRLMKGTLS